MGAVTEPACNPITGVPYPTPVQPKQPKLKLLPDPRREVETQIFDLDHDLDAKMYIGIILAQCGLPYSDPGPMCGIYTRNNGGIALSLNRGSLLNPYTEQFEMQGYPYGTRPRLAMLHFCTEATRRKSPEIYLGDTFNEFMRLGLGIEPTGGMTGSINTMKYQLKCLFAAHMRFYFRTGEHRMTMLNPTPFFKRFDIWFPTTLHEVGKWDGAVTISDEVFIRLADGCMPVRRSAVVALQQSPMALDIYTWLAYRNGAWRRKENKSNTISRAALRAQFGPEYALESDFWKKFLKSLRAVKLEYPEVKFEVAPGGGLVLYRSPTPVAKTKFVVTQQMMYPG